MNLWVVFYLMMLILVITLKFLMYFNFGAKNNLNLHNKSSSYVNITIQSFSRTSFQKL